ncbi:MAG: hypothetical protein BWK78_05925 [Thiotrichaceae bacterium IS1]|nr:MAG: hypothetical protein BWK78_05925 [Thiotrichaceae bacterium IS1]
MNSEFPYPGLRPYKRTESDIFFGRTEHVLTLLEKLEKGLHFVAVSGTSGSGKSSVIRAGLLASLNLAPTGKYWRKVVMRPGNAPFTNLAKAFLKDDKSPDQGDLALRKEYVRHYNLNVDSAREHLEKILRISTKSLHKILSNVLPDNHNLLIVVDQFEELFRHTQDELEVELFIDWLLASCEHPDTYVAITLRSEFIDRECAQYPSLHQAIMDHLFSIPCLPPESLPEIIEGPAGIFASQVKDDLKTQLLEDVQKLEFDHRADQLPLLQYALYRLWQEASEGKPDEARITLTLQQYQNIGGLKALAHEVEKAYQSVKPAHRKAVEIIFRRLSRCDEEGQYVRQVATLESLAELTGKNWASIPEVINDFRYRGFLTPPYESNLDSPINLIDIPHESIIRQWERLKSWANVEKEWVYFCERLQERAQSESNKKGELLHGLDLENALAWLNNLKELYETEGQQKAWAR